LSLILRALNTCQTKFDGWVDLKELHLSDEVLVEHRKHLEAIAAIEFETQHLKAALLVIFMKANVHLLWALEGVQSFPGLSDIKCDAIGDNLKV
jgi:hypothetical protein